MPTRLVYTMLLALVACRVPDEVEVRGDYRMEQFRGGQPEIDYTGPSLGLSGRWYLSPRPVSISLDTDSKIFLQGTSKGDSTPVSVHVEKQTSEEGGMVEKTVGALEKAGKDKDGNWTVEGVFALLIIAVVVVTLLFWLNKRKDPK